MKGLKLRLTPETKAEVERLLDEHMKNLREKDIEHLSNELTAAKNPYVYVVSVLTAVLNSVSPRLLSEVTGVPVAKLINVFDMAFQGIAADLMTPEIMAASISTELKKILDDLGMDVTVVTGSTLEEVEAKAVKLMEASKEKGKKKAGRVVPIGFNPSDKVH